MTDAGPLILIVRRCGEDPLPRPFAISVGVLASQCPGKRYPAQATLQVIGALTVRLSQLCGDGLAKRLRQHGHSVGRPLGIAKRDLAASEVHIFDPQREPFKKTHPRAVEEQGDNPRRSIKVPKYGRDLFARQHHGQSLRLPCARHAFDPVEGLLKDLLVEEQECSKRLILR